MALRDLEVDAMLVHLKRLHYTYKMITKTCDFARSKIANYKISGGISDTRCPFTDEEKERLTNFYIDACDLAKVEPFTWQQKLMNDLKKVVAVCGSCGWGGFRGVKTLNEHKPCPKCGSALTLDGVDPASLASGGE